MGRKVLAMTKRGSANPLPENGVSTLPVDRYSEAFGMLGIDHSAIRFSYVGTINVLHTTFLHLRSHANTSFLHLANHYFPVVGLSHLTRVQRKTQSCWTPGLSFSLNGRGRAGDGQSPKGGLNSFSNALQI